MNVYSLLKYELVKGDVRIRRPRVRLIDQEERFETIEKGLLLLTKCTTDWEIQVIEWKNILEIILAGIPDKIDNNITIRSKKLLLEAKKYLSIRARATSWGLIQKGVLTLMEELNISRRIGRTLIQCIYKLLKPKPLNKIVQNGINWNEAMKTKPANHKFDQNGTIC